MLKTRLIDKISTHKIYTCLLITLLSLPYATMASGQSRFGLQLDGGGALPLSDYVHSGIRLIGAPESEASGSIYTSNLVDQYVNFGFSVSGALLLDRYEIRYGFFRFPWDRVTTACSGIGEAIPLSNGEIDDATVTYDCGLDENQGNSTLSDSGFSPLNLHAISLGYRYPLILFTDVTQIYGVGALGIGLSNYTDNQPEESTYSALLSLGLGSEIGLFQQVSLAVDVRYSGFYTGVDTRSQSASNRASARDEGVFRAALNAFHTISFTGGIRINFR